MKTLRIQSKTAGIMAAALMGIAALGASFPAFADTTITTIAAPQGTSAVPCTSLPYNLSIGMYDGSAVTTLQTFLNASGYMSYPPTGYFGALTYRAAVNFQASQGISPTGFVGPITRARIQEMSCNQNPNPTPIPNPTTPVAIYSINPTAGPVGTLVTVTGRGFTSDNTVMFAGGAIAHVASSGGIAIACTNDPSCIPGIRQSLTFSVPSAVGPYCAPGMMCPMYLTRLMVPGTYQVAIMNQNGTSNSASFTITSDGSTGMPISLSGIDAPNSLPMGTPGTWTVHTNSSQPGNLHYSVVWGDEQVYASGAIMAPAPSSVSGSATFSHTYYRAGTYTPTFTVSDDYGHSVTASSSIVVTPLY